MTEVMHRAFTVTECPRCPDLILVGMVGGVRFRIDRRTVPVADAVVLRRYGTPVLVLDRGVAEMRAEWWEPGQYDLSKPDRHLVVPHVCSSAHATQAPRPVRRQPAPVVTDDRPPY